METVVVNRPFENDIEAMVAFCRTMKSREAWPGAVPALLLLAITVLGGALRLYRYDALSLWLDDRARGPYRRLGCGPERAAWERRFWWVAQPLLMLPGNDLRNELLALSFERIVVTEFPDVEAAKQFYNSPEYQEARKHRLGACDFHMVVVEGAP